MKNEEIAEAIKRTPEKAVTRGKRTTQKKRLEKQV
jgi:hypothetical protein